MSRLSTQVLLVPLLIALPRLAAADTAPSGLEAISDHAARQTAETIACTSPPARRYLRHALRDIDARRWGTVMTSLQGDTVDLVADAVYAGVPLRAYVGEPAATCSANGRAAARSALDEAEESGIPTEVDRCLARPFPQRRHDPACSLAAAVRGALDGDPSAARTHVADLVATITFDVIYTGKDLPAAQVDALYEHVAYALRQVMLTRENEDTIEEDVARAFGDVDLDAVRGWQCDDAAKPVAGDDLATFCAATRADYTPPVAKVADQPVDLETLARAARAAPAPDRDAKIAEALLGKPDPKAAPAKIELGDRTFTAAKPAGLGDAIDAAVDVARLRGDLVVLVRDQLLGTEVAPERLRDLAVVALRLRRVAHVLDDAMGSSDRNAYVLGPLEVLPTLLPRFSDAAVSVRGPVLRATSGELRATVIAAEDGHLRELATSVAALVGPRDRTSCIAPAAAGLLDAFAANVPEVRSHEDAWAGHEQIRGAAREVATCTTATRADPVLKLSILPSPALRASWNGAYRNAVGPDGFRLVPSLDLLSARIRLTPSSAKVRAAAIVSVLDLAAPLAELAMRDPDLKYDRQATLWLDAIRPRLDVAFSVPSISSHLSVVGGFALRTVAPYRGGGGKGNDTATYLAVGTPGGAAAEAFASYVEYSLGAKYVF
ncbi:MAG: hypothetical protein KIT84_20810 [Labilithrix sp.]|nr:hypothetical protein [Labilithrix sp.]MCW5813483.1 hypothetical protein [Labilithrix sp.]